MNLDIAAEAAGQFYDKNQFFMDLGHREGFIGELAPIIQAAIKKDREYRRDVLLWEQGYKCGKAESKVRAEMESESRASQAGEPIICPYCEIEQETLGGFIAHLKLLHPRAAQAGGGGEKWTVEINGLEYAVKKGDRILCNLLYRRHAEDVALALNAARTSGAAMKEEEQS